MTEIAGRKGFSRSSGVVSQANSRMRKSFIVYICIPLLAALDAAEEVTLKEGADGWRV
jgi:hypothetical protein